MRDENLICICYAGGYRGHAVAHILNYSPEILDQRERIVPISQYGDVHMTWTRYGHTASGSFSSIPLSVQHMANHCGIDLPTHDLPTHVVDSFYRHLKEALLEIGDSKIPFLKALEMHKVVVAEHVSVEVQLQLFPRCKCVVLTGHNHRALRAWCDKFLLRRNRRNGMINMDQILGERAIDRRTQKAFIRGSSRASAQMTASNACHAQAFSVDIDKLFDSSTAQATYQELCSRLELTAMWPEVSEFIIKYNRSQLQRGVRTNPAAPP